MYHVYIHEFSLVIHDAGLILFFTFLPLLYPVIYSLVYNPELVKDVSMVVVDNDRTPMSRELMRRLDACDQAHVIGYAANLPEGRRAMDEHKAFAILEIPEGFERNIGLGEEANAVMYCDMSLLLRYRGFLVATTNVMQSLGGDITTERINTIAPLADTLVTGDLLPIENISMGNIRNGFDSFIMPGVIILILQQCLILAAGMAGGAKRERTAVVGYNPVNSGPSVLLSMFAQGLCYITIIILPAIFMIHYVPLIFSFPMKGNLLEEIAFILPLIIGSVAMGFTLQGVVRERESVFVIWVMTSIFFLFLSGLIWPRYDMWGFWRAVSAAFPATWGVEGFIKMNANGARLWQVSDCYINLWIVAAAWTVVAYCVQKWIVRPIIATRLKSAA